jgi:citronellyl-CoA dehydrogenase
MLDMTSETTTTRTAYRDRLGTFLHSYVYPYVAELESTHTFPEEIVRQLGREGFFTPCIREERETKQKLPLNVGTFGILIEELAKTKCFGLTLTVSMHVGVFIPLISRLAHPDIREELLYRALRGEILGTVAATEARVAGSDFMGMESTVTFESDHILLDGQKHYITNAAVADYVIVFARQRPGRHFTNFCALLVPTNLPGIHRSRIDMAVMQTAVTSHIDFEHVRLDPLYQLGRKGLGMQYFLQHIAVERISGGVWAAAVATQCLEEAQRYAMQRVIGTQTLWERDAVRHRISEAVTAVTLLHHTVDAAIAEADRDGQIAPFTSAVIKAAVAPMMEHVIGTCLQLQGAYGLEAQSPLLRLLNDFRVFGVAGGSTETMLDVIAELWADQAARAVERAPHEQQL